MTEIWVQSIDLMLLGMSTVFIFLTLLVFFVSIMSSIINKITQHESATMINDSDIAAVAAIAYSENHSQQ